jgi:D-alanyl-lipoteichoic acid acyltransferase DltB (MBOAT superfamily)
MFFNSYEFIFFFLPITFVVYFFLLNKRLVVGAKGFLIFASLFFYSWWNIVYLPIILSSMLLNYVIGNSLNKYKKSHNIFSKKSFLIFGIVCNIALLGYFKYADFFIENFNFAFGSNIELLNLALPLAISFFTFQQIAYLVDSYKGQTKEYDFLNYAVFVTFFPQLIAGPIVHHKEMMPQFANVRNKVKNYRNIATGLFIFSIGLFKKVVIADTFAIWATAGFDTATTLNLVEAWVTSLSYTFQLYFDFSGYADMAIGTALLFNIRLPINFNSPYKAINIQDFWRRWHITLSRFLKDYVYIPLGGNRKGEFRTYNNLLVTFIIGGIWHGAGWTFVFWGILHGIALVIHRVWSKLEFKLWDWLAWLITFNFINIAWIFFRAREWEDAIKILEGMFGFNYIAYEPEYFYFMNQYLWIALSFILILFFSNSTQQIKTFKASTLEKIQLITFFAFSILAINKTSEFLYFNF